MTNSDCSTLYPYPSAVLVQVEVSIDLSDVLLKLLALAPIVLPRRMSDLPFLRTTTPLFPTRLELDVVPARAVDVVEAATLVLEIVLSLRVGPMV